MTTTRLAIPLFGDVVAPRFGFADEFLVAEVQDGSVVSTERLTMDGAAWPERLAKLAASGVGLLLCGGFNRRFWPVADSHGIRVVWGLAGRADQLIDAFCRDGLHGVQGPFRTGHQCCSARSEPAPREPLGLSLAGSARQQGQPGRRRRRKRRRNDA
ncbi:MAG: NifB/NifX family molybdenum-iron cluster-binding protein [Deltaproteobacteria bacterium]|nr:NifB/NifX family molybdenum-iron cluster-binding protein [Deltaproteobacteria bacterium]